MRLQIRVVALFRNRVHLSPLGRGRRVFEAGEGILPYLSLVPANNASISVTRICSQESIHVQLVLNMRIVAYAFQTRRANCVEYPLAVLEEFNIPETDNSKPLLAQVLFSPLVRFFVANVSVAIEFDNEPCDRAVEVGDIRADWLLTTESEVCESAVAKETPHQTLGR
jgi:hypothetical protein